MATASTSSNALTQTPSRSDLALVTTSTATTRATVTSVSQCRRSQTLAGAVDDTLIHCPSCDTKLHRFEVASHCEQEMQRLKEMSIKSPTVALTTNAMGNTNEIEDEEAEGSSSSGNVQAAERRKPWSVFQKVQKNRQSRMKQRTRKRPAAPEQTCPVCNVTFPQDEIQEHADACLQRSNRTANGRSNSDDHSSNDGDGGGGGDGGEEYEEYEWAGQKRIRVSSLLQGGYAAIGIGQTIRNGSSGSNRLNGHAAVDDDDDEDDEDLNVDEDDTQIYGPAQYGESDVIPSHILNEDESDVTSYMRRLITAGSSANSTAARETNTTTTDSLHLNSSIANNDIIKEPPSVSTMSSDLPTTPAHYQQIIDSLKAKLRHYEQQHIPGKYKCLICLDDYRNPAISVACWHVHCEQCWLRSLGARKLCPQCNLITTPKDLRRIYM